MTARSRVIAAVALTVSLIALTPPPAATDAPTAALLPDVCFCVTIPFQGKVCYCI